MSRKFEQAYEASTSKGKALTIRVWLGDRVGAKVEWTTDGVYWIEEHDTRDIGGARNEEVYLGWNSRASAVFIDDIVVETD